MTTLAQISETQAQKATTANENFDALAYAGLFGRRAAGISGLTWAYYGGILYVAGVATAIADGTVALTLNLTNYVEATTAGVVSANTVGFTAGRMPLYTVVCGATTISSYADQRSRNLVGDFTAKGNVTIGGTLGVTGTITAAAITASGQVQVTKTGNADAAGIYQNAAGQSTIAIRDSTQAVDAKLWDMSVGIVANALIFRTINDAISVASTWLSVLRAGTNITSVTFPNGSVIVSGALTGTTAAFTKAAAGDVITFTNGGATPKTGYLYTDGSSATFCTGASATGTGIYLDVTSSRIVFNTGSTVKQVEISNTASATRYITLTGSNGVFPQIGVSAGHLECTAGFMVSGTLSANKANTIAIDYAGSPSNLRIFFHGTDNATSGILTFKSVTANGGGNGDVMTLGAGLQLGAPTGGDKGVGTVNHAGDIYKNNTAYTNPDYVLEHWATGRIQKYRDKDGADEYSGLQSLFAVRDFAREHWHLPRFGQKAGHGLFSGSDALLASVEESYLYLFDHEARLAELEKNKLH